MKSRFRALKQHQLDTALQRWRGAGLPVRPSIGWIKAIREALGMPAAYLAKKMDMTHSSLLRLESSEADDGITLGSLRRVAEALECELQYALVPRKSLTETLEAQATKLAQERMRVVAHTMALEAQSTSEAIAENQLKEIKESLLKGSLRELWR
jgi:predicted DNA-binding mobile mystery protein A